MSSDGTSIRKITYEAHHITLPVPDYTPGADNSDPSKFKFKTHFAAVKPGFDHTGESQFAGGQEIGQDIIDTYNVAPISDREGVKLDKEDWI